MGTGSHGGMANREVDTLYGVIARQAKVRPEQDALIANGAAVSYRALLGRVDALRARLRQVGVHSIAQRVYLAELSKLDLLIGALATVGCGGIAALSASGDRDTIVDCDPTVVFTSNPDKYRAYASGVILTPLADQHSGPSAEIGRATGDTTAPALIMYTSGTTSGTRRGVILTHGILTITTGYMNQVMGLDDTVREYVMSSLEHSFGFARCRAVFHAGGTLIFDEGLLNPARVLLAVSLHKCNAMSSVSTGFAILLRRFDKQLARIGPQIQWCEIGSLPLPVELKSRMLSLMPAARIFMHYGLTEASRSTFLDLRKDKGKLESVGKAAPGVEVRIEDGEVLVRGPNVTPGYWQRPAEWEERFRDGWLYTGDLGRMDENGFVYVQGRKDDVINVGGQKVLPKPVEDALSPLIPHQVLCVLGVPDPEGLLGDVPILAVEGSSAPTVKEIRAFLRDRIPEYAVPKNVVLLESFPRTPNGKIQRRLIRRRLTGNQATDE